MIEVEENAKAVARKEAREECQAAFTTMMSAFVKWIRENPDVGEFPIPSFVASNSMNKAADNVMDNSPVDRSGAHSDPSSVSGMPGGGAATLAQLEDLMVTN